MNGLEWGDAPPKERQDASVKEDRGAGNGIRQQAGVEQKGRKTRADLATVPEALMASGSGTREICDL